MPGFQKIYDKAQELIFKSAEGIGSVFDKGPQKLADAFRGMKAGMTRPKIGAAFQGLGGGIKSGVFGAASGIGKSIGPAASSVGGYFANIGRALTHAVPLGRAIGGNLRTAGSAIGGMFGGRVGRAATAVGAGVTGVASMGMKAAGGLTAAPFKAVSAAFTKLASTTTGAPKAAAAFMSIARSFPMYALTVFGLKKLVEALAESNRSLAKWNGSLAASFAKLDIQQMRLDIQTAKATSGTAVGLNEAFGDLLTEFQPIREDLAILVNVVGIELAKGTKTLLEIAKAAATTFPFLKDAVDHLRALEDEAKKKNKPGNFPGNVALGGLAGMGGGAEPRPLPQPRPFLNPGPAMTPQERLRAKRLMMRFD